MKSLRKEFILSSFLTVAGILTLLLWTLNAFDFAHAAAQSEEALNILVDNGGRSAGGEMGQRVLTERKETALPLSGTLPMPLIARVTSKPLITVCSFWRGRSGDKSRTLLSARQRRGKKPERSGKVLP